MKRFLFVLIALVGVMAATPSVHATPLAPGGASPTSDIFTLSGIGSLYAQWSGVILAKLNPPTVGKTTIVGTYQEWVYRNATTGFLTFLEQVNLSTLAKTSIERITAAYYTGFTTDVGYLTGPLPPTGVAGGIIPNNTGTGAVIDLSTDGNTVGFNFLATPIKPGMSSAVLVIATNAKAYDNQGVLNVIDSSTSTNLTFEPLAATPEPSSLAIAGLGALGLIGYGLRRRKALGA